MQHTIIEVIQLVAKGFEGMLRVIGTDITLEVYPDAVGDPMYVDIEAPETPMEQAVFYRRFQHRMFEVDVEAPVRETAPAPVADDEDEGEEEEADELDPEDLSTWSDEDLAQYLVEVAGEDRRNWKRSTMIEKIERFMETGSAD